VSNAKTSILYGYTRPIIDNQEYGYIECEQLRHPIIERLIDYEYVAHNVSLGKNLKGLLLYGLNSSGKSSMMKALGISVIMAQCGMFVPAKKFVYSLYTSIFTRISGNDNIFKELSSFSVEMMELKAIWKRSNMKSLIIGDEVCRGTEQVSANSIVAATLIKLSQQKASFIFATHLHEIVKLPQIQTIKNIKAFHLSVSYDDKNDRLIFDRLLKEGSGEEIYGITVAKYIIQDDDFTSTANSIKDEILGMKDGIIQQKVSKYNTHIYVNKCSICGKQLQVKDDIVNLDTHHINHQKDCVDGFVNDKKYIKKNDKSNLIVLCKKCHNKIHNGEIIVDKYAASTSGKILKYKEENSFIKK
jgi:DNA mismatch repair protein MutS